MDRGRAMVQTILTNISSEEVSIDDLGIILKPGESTSLNYFNEIQIIESVDLRVKFDLVQIKLNDSVVSYVDFITSFQKLTTKQHEDLNTLQHNQSKESFMQSTKIDGKTKYITYYRDSSKLLKEREEEIERDENGRSLVITQRQYDDNGNLLYTEVQTLNRENGGRVESITITKS